MTRWHLGARHAVKTENVAGITAGTSRLDVEALLGCPADEYIPVARDLEKRETKETEGESFAGTAEVRLTVGDWQTAGGPYARVVFGRGEGDIEEGRAESRGRHRPQGSRLGARFLNPNHSHPTHRWVVPSPASPRPRQNGTHYDG